MVPPRPTRRSARFAGRNAAGGRPTGTPVDPAAGTAPCVVVSDPLVAANRRYPLLGVVPLTGAPVRGALYPRVAAGTGGLRKDSWALADQVRSIGKRRVAAVFRPVDPATLEAIDEGLRLFLGLAPAAAED